jgi:hypothetical protein
MPDFVSWIKLIKKQQKTQVKKRNLYQRGDLTEELAAFPQVTRVHFRKKMSF